MFMFINILDSYVEAPSASLLNLSNKGKLYCYNHVICSLLANNKSTNHVHLI